MKNISFWLKFQASGFSTPHFAGVFFSASPLLAALLPTCKLNLSGILPLLLRGLNLESDWVGYHPAVTTETLFPYCKMDTNRLLGEFSKIILAMCLIHIQHILGSPYMSTFILMQIFFLSHLICFQDKSSHVYCSSPFFVFQCQLQSQYSVNFFSSFPLNTCLLYMYVFQEWQNLVD